MTEHEIKSLKEGTQVRVLPHVDCHPDFKKGGTLVFTENPLNTYPYGVRFNLGVCYDFHCSEIELLSINKKDMNPYFTVKATCTNEFGTSEKSYSNCHLRIGDNGNLHFTKMVSTTDGEIEKSLNEIHAGSDLDSTMSFRVLSWKIQENYLY